MYVRIYEVKLSCLNINLQAAAAAAAIAIAIEAIQ